MNELIRPEGPQRQMEFTGYFKQTGITMEAKIGYRLLLFEKGYAPEKIMEMIKRDMLLARNGDEAAINLFKQAEAEIKIREQEVFEMDKKLMNERRKARWNAFREALNKNEQTLPQVEIEPPRKNSTSFLKRMKEFLLK